MRRKGSRNSRKSASEKEDPLDSSMGDSNGQSIKRLSRFDSKPVNENNEQSTECNNPDQGSEIVQNTSTDPENVSNEINNSVSDNKEENEKDLKCQQDGDNEEEKDIKGKSKGKSNKKVEQSRSSKPEIENDNVQGSIQSPPKDNDESIENSSGTAQENTHENPEPNDGNIAREIVNEQGSESSTQANFESAYVQDGDVSSEIPNEGTQSSNNINESISCGERSTTPEIKHNASKSDALVRSQSDDNDRKSTGEKKRIILRRSLPKSTQENDDSKKFNQDENIKDIPRKKIVLKRLTPGEKAGGEKNSSVDEKPEEDSKNIRRRESSTSEESVEKKRRLSSQSEERVATQEKLNKPIAPIRKVKLLRHVPQPRDSQGDKSAQRTRRHLWGKSDSLNNLSATTFKIDVDAIKIVCPSLEFLKESEVKLDSVPRVQTKSESETVKRKLSTEKSEDEKFKRQVSEETTEEQKSETNQNIIALNRKISIVDDTISKMRPPPSPAKNSRSDILYITNLVRPFTVKQLKELLERTGKIREDGFWTDRIKSKCYVQYESEEEAEATRNALHGIFWPIGNGKRLVIDYATAEDMEKARKPVPAEVAPVLPEKLPEKENREPVKVDNRQNEHEREQKQRHTPVREWNKTKEDTRRKRSRSGSKSRDRERVRKHSHRSYTPEFINKMHKQVEEPVPQKRMDDLFLKTKATPSIYWKPLTPQEIATKQQQRLVRMEQHKRRIEETRGRMRDVRRAPFRRR
ncbi:apoptotic chromatin condensation inducer acinus isoform X1 [Leptinotarsa decemlineata]|uniref:apoptotic chromatin condensation inducer acinus isoform X1 n=1 Tax=Leptinotarsa decemlineata TaxID=7539 RepID=UPI003D308BCA